MRESHGKGIAVVLAGLVTLGAAPSRAADLMDALRGVEAGAVRALAQAARPQLDQVLERQVRELVAHADGLLDAIALKASTEEDLRLREASRHMFGRTRVEKVAIRGFKATGSVEHVEVRLRDLEVHGVNLDLVEVELDDVAIDTGELLTHGRVKLAHDLHARLRVRVGADAVNQVTGRYRVAFSPGEVGVSFHTGNAFCHATVAVRAALESTPDNQLIVKPTSVTLGWLPLPEVAYGSTVARHNPVYDLKQSLGVARGAVDLHLGKIAIGQDTVEIAVEGNFRPGAATQLASAR